LLIQKVRAQLLQEVELLRPFGGIPEVLQELRSNSIELGIITSNSYENVQKFLIANNLSAAFAFVHSSASIFGKHRILDRVLQQRKINPAAALYVGDETRDIEACKKSSVRAIAVCWGFNTEQILAERQPDFLIHSPPQLLDIVKQLASIPCAAEDVNLGT